MAEITSCEKHPNAPSIATCSNCDIGLCGMCANFTETEVLCEDCAEIREAEKFVSTQTSKLETRNQGAKIEPLQTEPAKQTQRNKASSQQTFQWGVIILASGIILYQLFFASRSDFVPMDTAAIIQQNAAVPFNRCVSIFREIGSLLRVNEMPDETLRCDESGTPNIISREGGDITISYPHPDFYGYTQIFVSRNNPEPTLIE